MLLQDKKYILNFNNQVNQVKNIYINLFTCPFVIKNIDSLKKLTHALFTDSKLDFESLQM